MPDAGAIERSIPEMGLLVKTKPRKDRTADEIHERGLGQCEMSGQDRPKQSRPITRCNLLYVRC
jgi:hypothetical protein